MVMGDTIMLTWIVHTRNNRGRWLTVKLNLHTSTILSNLGEVGLQTLL